MVDNLAADIQVYYIVKCSSIKPPIHVTKSGALPSKAWHQDSACAGRGVMAMK